MLWEKSEFEVFIKTNIKKVKFAILLILIEN